MTLEINHKYIGRILEYGIKTEEFILKEEEIHDTVTFISLASEGLYKRILANSQKTHKKYKFTMEDSAFFHHLLIKGISSK